jgi:hypothetical protein
MRIGIYLELIINALLLSSDLFNSFWRHSTGFSILNGVYRVRFLPAETSVSKGTKINSMRIPVIEA